MNYNYTIHNAGRVLSYLREPAFPSGRIWGFHAPSEAFIIAVFTNPSDVDKALTWAVQWDVDGCQKSKVYIRKRKAIK